MQSFTDLAEDVTKCIRCPRVISYCQEAAITKKRMYLRDDYWSKPVSGFGDPCARILIVGLAPAVHGANRTGRMFTGDGTDGMGASDFLASALHRSGYANKPISRHREDGFKLHDVFMTSITRCAPPGNKPLRSEIDNCANFLHIELDLLKRLRIVIPVGKLAFEQMLKVFEERGAIIPKPRPKFSHGAIVNFGRGLPRLLASYHPSRQNTQTGRLTPDMLDSIFSMVRDIVN
jgi:uracil-DNA glycosylase family 4